MTSDGFVIRTMTRGELDIAIEWAAAEGWNPGLHDADAYYAVDPEGFFIGLLEGEPAGSISAVKYDAGYVFWGFFIVKPEHRGRGYGLRLWQHAEAALNGAIAGLDGVLAQTQNYARSGFVEAYHNLRYRGVAGSTSDIDPRVAVYTRADLDAVERYDRRCFPAPRHAFLDRWLRQPQAHALLYRDGDGLAGYGMVRPARDGYRIGPLFANGAREANALFVALVLRLPRGAPVYIDVPQPNGVAIDLVTRRGMTPMFGTARMYRGPSPVIDLAKVFGVTTLELG